MCSVSTQHSLIQYALFDIHGRFVLKCVHEIDFFDVQISNFILLPSQMRILYILNI